MVAFYIFEREMQWQTKTNLWYVADQNGLLSGQIIPGRPGKYRHNGKQWISQEQSLRISIQRCVFRIEMVISAFVIAMEMILARHGIKTTDSYI